MRNVKFFSLSFPVVLLAPVFFPHRKLHFMEAYDFVGGGVFFYPHPRPTTSTHDSRPTTLRYTRKFLFNCKETLKHKQALKTTSAYWQKELKEVNVLSY